MTPHTSHCCRTLQRQIISSKDSVWISDSLLDAAFERYCRVSNASKTWRRNASHVPGPLESRRRLGKRQLGGLHAFQDASPPGWAFPVPMDLSQWQWEPPSSISALRYNRLDRQAQAAAANWISSTLPGWLGDWVPQVAPDSVPTLSDLAPSGTATTQEPPFLRAELDSFLLSVANAPMDVLVLDTQHICRKLRQHIILGEMAAEHIMSISDEVWGALNSRFEDCSAGHGMVMALYSVVVDGIATSRVFTPHLLNASFWNTMLIRISKLPLDDELCNLFGRIMPILPTVHHDEVLEGLLSMLNAYFNAWGSSPKWIDGAEISRLIGTASESYDRVQELLWGLPVTIRRSARDKLKQATSSTLQSARAELDAACDALASANAAMTAQTHYVQTLSKSMEAIGLQKHRQLLDAANQLIVEQTPITSTRRHELRYNWLCVLAQLPRVNQEFLFESSAYLSESSLAVKPMSSAEVCSLILYQWVTRGYLKNPARVYKEYQGLCLRHGDEAFASLAVAISLKEDFKTRSKLYFSLWKFLTKLDRSNEMVESLRGFSRTGLVGLPTLQALAYSARNHYVAMDLRKLYVDRIQKPGQSEWNPAIFKKYAEKIVSDPSLPAGVIWQVLDIDMFQDKDRSLRSKMRRHLGTFGTHRAAIVKEMAASFSNTPHLRNRVAFRHVSRCVRFLEEHKDGLSPPVVKALYHVVARDMREGRPGRTTRLRWFLAVVHRNFGAELATGCRLALERWRIKLKEIWYARGGGTRDE
ncbi:hypothetical protein B0T17DRAFT_335407 [Bombardia bombarda]|uniref:Uncharacterized protein n=1 Tax=Bombardia bombarda TaxID=252184 RepID=A0AA40BYN2_9PEZI|nr:hypothetical protein B0T17DRAFT_335407 [Bombardia bombarda]